MNNTKKVTIYTDGACSGNPGPGGYGVVLIYKGHTKQLSGFEAETTNNRMELYAVIYALQALNQPCEVDLYSDSAYVINALSEGWLESWQSNNWRTADKKAVKNVDLWTQLIPLLETHQVTFIKVKGHSNVQYNEMCDRLATEEIAKHAQSIEMPSTASNTAPTTDIQEK